MLSVKLIQYSIGDEWQNDRVDNVWLMNVQMMWIKHICQTYSTLLISKICFEKFPTHEANLFLICCIWSREYCVYQISSKLTLIKHVWQFHNPILLVTTCTGMGTISMKGKNRARFLSLARSKLSLCSANHRPGYWSNLSCDWPSRAWAYSEQETESGPRSIMGQSSA